MEYHELVDPDLARHVEKEVTEARLEEDGTVVFPAGSYWIGDPGYGLDRKNPDFEQMRLANRGSRALELNRFGICIGRTVHGDGSDSLHRCNYRKYMGDIFEFVMVDVYHVDSGTVAIIPAELINKDQEGGVRVKSAVPFAVAEGKREWLVYDEVGGDLILHIQI